MTRPHRYLTRMLVFVALVVALIAVLFTPLRAAFMAAPALNGLIVGVLLLGIIYNFRQVWMLGREAAWTVSFRTGQVPTSGAGRPRLLAPMVAMLGEHTGRLSLSASSMRTVLDGIAARLDESRELSRYLIGLLIFLGLLGTFWGLLETIAAVGNVIGNLSVGGGELTEMFARLKEGLQAPLKGMGLAFSSSLLGLSGSLVLGFLDLQAGQAQNRFFNELEEWLSTQTRLTGGLLASDGDQGVPAYVQALLEQTADHLEALQRTLARGEESRSSANASIADLAEKVGILTDQMRTEQNLMKRLAENQFELKPILARLADGGLARAGADDALTMHVQHLDVHVARLLEEMETGRAEMVRELRNEIRVLSRTLAAIAERPSREG